MRTCGEPGVWEGGAQLEFPSRGEDTAEQGGEVRPVRAWERHSCPAGGISTHAQGTQPSSTQSPRALGEIPGTTSGGLTSSPSKLDSKV